MVSPARTSPFNQPDVLVLFAYAPAGLGHLRVTDALRQGMPGMEGALLLGAQDRGLAVIHRLMSIHPTARAAMEWIQRGTPENVFTLLYRSALRLRLGSLQRQVETILKLRLDPPRTLVVIATHFALAHQFAAIKGWLWAQHRVRLVLVVQVTDDSPQHIWHVPGADLICVPSERTRQGLERYARRTGLGPATIRVVPYPVAPLLTEPLGGSKADRARVLRPVSGEPIRTCIPVSGAAVGLSFSRELIDGLHEREPRFRFTVVSRASAYTRPFLDRMLQRPFVDVRAADEDREVVRMYDEVYASQAIAMEVTKPSEQCFKALCRPDQRGGSILLLQDPVQRQEHDNLDFLRRHGLLPRPAIRDRLWSMALGDDEPRKDLLVDATLWRALELPNRAKPAAAFVLWALRVGLLLAMTRCRVASDARDPHSVELASDGVARFWREVARQV